MPVIAWIIIAIIAAGATTAVVVPAVMSEDEPPATSTELPEGESTKIETRITDPIDAPATDREPVDPFRWDDSNTGSDDQGNGFDQNPDADAPIYDPGDWGDLPEETGNATRNAGGAVNNLPF